MYYHGATTKKEILKRVLEDLPIFIMTLVLLYFTFEGLWKFIFDLITGKTIIITN